MNQKINLRGERTFAENINVTFNFLRENFKTIMMLMIRIAGPWFLIAILFMIPQQFVTVNQFETGQISDDLVPVGLNAFGLILLMIANALGLAVVYEYISVYQEGENQVGIDKSAIVKKARQKFWSYLGASILVFLIAFIGFMMLFFPGIYLLIVTSLVFPIIAVEKISVPDAISRSFKVIRGNWWNTFGFLFVISLLLMTIYSLVNFPAMMMSGFMVFKPESMNIAYTIITVIVSTISYAITFFIYVIYYISTSVVYFSLVEQQEQVGLKEQIESMTDIELEK